MGLGVRQQLLPLYISTKGHLTMQVGPDAEVPPSLGASISCHMVGAWAAGCSVPPQQGGAPKGYISRCGMGLPVIIGDFFAKLAKGHFGCGEGTVFSFTT